jgi:two-component system, NtrC family, response regulator GlrR
MGAMNYANPVLAEGDSDRSQLQMTVGLGQIVGQSPAFVHALRQIPTIAKYNVCALVLGETGTGKEVFARAIHYHSGRSAKAFVPVNCGALPTELIESEFFGHQQGAFTGANACQRGLIKEADGGTLFLDEVDSLPTHAQVKLLRFIQDGKFRPLGSERLTNSDVRIIAASNIDLIEAIRCGRFREDLYYRLNVVSVKLPALRDREDDIVLLASHFLAKCHDKFGGEPKQLSPTALQKLISYRWPGNVRELENAVQRSFILAENTMIQPQDLCLGVTEADPDDMTFQKLKTKIVDDFEKAYIRRVLRLHGGNITKAAQSAGKHRRAFWELMRKHHIGVRSEPSSAGFVRQISASPGQTYPTEEVRAAHLDSLSGFQSP